MSSSSRVSLIPFCLIFSSSRSSLKRCSSADKSLSASFPPALGIACTTVLFRGVLVISIAPSFERGVDKGNDYSMVEDLVRDKVKAIICLGKDNEKIHKAFEGIVETIVDTTSAEEAVKTSCYLGKKGATVLLSPACASFDLFENYEERGRQFKAAVRAL